MKLPIEKAIEHIRTLIGQKKTTRFEFLENKSDDRTKALWFDRKLNHRERERIETFLEDQWSI